MKTLSFEPMETLNTGNIREYLIYNTKMNLGEAVKQAYILGASDKTRDVALGLRSAVQKASNDAEPLQWPPSARYLESLNIPIPSELDKFLFLLITGIYPADNRVKASRLVESIGQDICRATTNGHWKLPKHILLCMTLRHQFRSAELTTLLNRFGHSESYSFSLELETALAASLQESSVLLPTHVIRNPTLPALFHSDWDNFDKNTASGSIHTSHGIMLQEVGSLTESSDGEAAEVQSLTPSTKTVTTQRSKERSIQLEDTKRVVLVNNSGPRA